VFWLHGNSTFPLKFQQARNSAKTIGFCWLEICLQVIVGQISSQWKLVAFSDA
jgi:hypothetical protein